MIPSQPSIRASPQSDPDMARPSTPQGSLRQRSVPSKKVETAVFAPEVELDKLAKAAAEKVDYKYDTDYKIAFALITILAFVTRFWGISHPNEVVFDEVHFGKVRNYCGFPPVRPDLHPQC